MLFFGTHDNNVTFVDFEWNKSPTGFIYMIYALKKKKMVWL